MEIKRTFLFYGLCGRVGPMETNDKLHEKWLPKIMRSETGKVEIYNLASHEICLSEMVDDILAVLPEVEFDNIITVETGGLALAGALADRLRTRLVAVRKIHDKPRKEPLLRWTITNWRGEQEVLGIDTDEIKNPRSYLVFDDLCQTSVSFYAIKAMLDKTQNKIAAFLCFANISTIDEIMGIPIYSVVRIKNQ